MKDQFETKQALIHELNSLRQRIAELEQSESERKPAEEALRESESRFRCMAGEMAVIVEITRVIGSTLEIDEVYERFAAEAKKLIPFDSLAINLYNFEDNTMRVAHVSGVNIERRKQGDPLVVEGSLSETVILAQTGLCIQPSNIDEIVSRFPRLSAIFKSGLRSIMCVPLVSRDEVIGVLHFRSKTPNAYTDKDLQLAERIGGQIAGAIANAQLFSDLKQTEEALQRAHNELEKRVAARTEELMRVNEELRTEIIERKRAEEQLKHTMESLRKAFGTTVQVMVSAVETRDPYTSGHQIRSANIARAIATEMGLPLETIDGLRMAGSIHDIGKLSIPAEILSKPGKLSEIEFSLIKEHARKGFEMLKDVKSPWPLAQIVYQHHERMDGSGYPRNLKGDEILMEARIMAVADVVESMASHRPYRPALGIKAALEEIENKRKTLYDSDVADACLRLFLEKGFQIEGA